MSITQPHTIQFTMDDPISIQDIFKHTLLQQMTRYLHFDKYPGLHVKVNDMGIHITPRDPRTMMKIRLTLSWMEGHRVFYLSYAQLLMIFKSYCIQYYPMFYNLLSQVKM